MAEHENDTNLKKWLDLKNQGQTAMSGEWIF